MSKQRSIGLLNRIQEKIRIFEVWFSFVFYLVKGGSNIQGDDYFFPYTPPHNKKKNVPPNLTPARLYLTYFARQTQVNK